LKTALHLIANFRCNAQRSEFMTTYKIVQLDRILITEVEYYGPYQRAHKKIQNLRSPDHEYQHAPAKTRRIGHGVTYMNLYYFRTGALFCVESVNHSGEENYPLRVDVISPAYVMNGTLWAYSPTPRFETVPQPNKRTPLNLVSVGLYRPRYSEKKNAY
jgi:hypothetical protein